MPRENWTIQSKCNLPQLSKQIEHKPKETTYKNDWQDSKLHNFTYFFTQPESKYTRQSFPSCAYVDKLNRSHSNPYSTGYTNYPSHHAHTKTILIQYQLLSLLIKFPSNFYALECSRRYHHTMRDQQCSPFKRKLKNTYIGWLFKKTSFGNSRFCSKDLEDPWQTILLSKIKSSVNP